MLATAAFSITTALVGADLTDAVRKRA
jgi:hypothetical protein